MYFDLSNDHVSSNTIVCHQSPCDPKDDVSTFVCDSIPCSNFQLFNYLTPFEVCQRSHFLKVDDRDLENVSMGGHRSTKHAEIQAKNAFDEWRWFCGYETNMSIANMLEKEKNVKGLVNMFFLFVL